MPIEDFSNFINILNLNREIMNKIISVIFVLFLIGASPAYAHKLISHDDTHRSFDTALQIPDHKISWAIYEDLGVNEAKFYTFDAKHGDSFYASIVIPKINGLENYSPTLVLVGPGVFENDDIPYETQLGVEKFSFDGKFPGREFYEPFGQVTYWERQEVKTEIITDGQYFIVVMDEKNQSGKYSLAIGTIEDFSGGDFFTILPKAWFDTKLFVEDYASIGIFIAILFAIPAIPAFIIIRKEKRLHKSS